MEKTGIVVIGRNEGRRLSACFASLPAGVPAVYVDSGSSDDSVALARAAGLAVHELDPARPFSAARARNEGAQLLAADHPDLRYVQFVDGDCVLLPGWLAAAAAALEAEPGRAAVIGHLRERNAAATPYNRLCALEWASPAGDLSDYGALGGISMMRLDVFAELGGFNAEVIAGEDSELGVRMALAGHRVSKLDLPMALHDADIATFRQWWRRSVRAGHAIGQRASLNGRSVLRDCARESRSTWFWGIGLPLFVAATLLSSRGLSLLLLAAYPLLYYRVFRFRRRLGDGAGDAAFYARYLILAKFANGLGLLRFELNRLAKRYEIIEYK